MKKFLLFILLLFLILFDAFTYAHSIQNEIASNVVRLHIIANSDSVDDQNLKLKVRDNILKYMQTMQLDSIDSAYMYISNSLEIFEKIAKETLKANDCESDVKVEFKKCYFPKKEYDSLSFPSGEYTALRIIIGNGNGHNWWCVMFPALCFSNEICSSEAADISLKEALSDESFSIIANKSDFKFRIVDFFN